MEMILQKSNTDTSNKRIYDLLSTHGNYAEMYCNGELFYTVEVTNTNRFKQLLKDLGSEFRVCGFDDFDIGDKREVRFLW